jgi:hypothetical protein
MDRKLYCLNRKPYKRQPSARNKGYGEAAMGRYGETGEVAMERDGEEGLKTLK